MEDRGMSVFNVLTLFGGLAMFLFGMELMGQGLESASGGKLEKILENSEFFRYHSYGSWFCKQWNHDTFPGSRCHYGCQYRYDSDFLDPVTGRNRE